VEIYFHAKNRNYFFLKQGGCGKQPPCALTTQEFQIEQLSDLFYL